MNTKPKYYLIINILKVHGYLVSPLFKSFASKKQQKIIIAGIILEIQILAIKSKYESNDIISP